jgi:hypothetical protein
MTSPGSLQVAHPLLGALLLAGALFAWFLHRDAKRQEKQQAAWEQEQQARWRARYGDAEAGLREWLRRFGLGRAGKSAGMMQPTFPEGIRSRWMEMIFSNAFVPVIPLPQNQFETFGENL